jgi:hypothetical protein
LAFAGNPTIGVLFYFYFVFQFYLQLEKHRQQTLIKGFKKEKEKSSRVSNIPQVFPWYCTEGAGASDKSNFAWHISAIVLPCLISLA